LIIGIIQIDEIHFIIAIVCGRDRAHRQKFTTIAQASKSLLLLFPITREVRTFVGIMILATPSNAIAIQLA